MNMISTGAFQAGMTASSKENSALKNLVSAWEKKNSKVARAGGLSLMALSLAACGSEDTTPFSQVDVDAAKAASATAATTAALTGSDGTVHATVDAAVTSNDSTVTTAALTGSDGTVHSTVDAAVTAGSATTNAAAVTAALTDANGVVHNNVDAAITSNDAAVTTTATLAAEAGLLSGSGFNTVADLLTAYNTAVAPTSAASVTLTSSTETVVETFTGVNDTVTGAFGTVNAGDIIIDSFTTDSDVANLTIDTAVAATMANIETINIDARDNGAADQFVVDAINMSGYSRMSVDSNYAEVDFLVNDLLDGSTLAFDSTATSITFNMNRTGSAESHTTSATVEIGSGTTANFDKTATDDVDALTINSLGTVASVLTLDETEDYLSTAASPDSLTVTGSNSLTLVMSQEVNAQGFDGGAITNSLTGDATLTLRLTDDDAAGDTALEGAQIDLDAVNADVIQLDTITQDATDLLVASGQVISTRAADDIVGDIKITTAAGGNVTLNLAAGEANTSTDTIEFVSVGTANINNTAGAAITYIGTDITTSYAGIGNSSDLNIGTGAGLTINTAAIAAEAGSTLDAITITGGGDFTTTGATATITAASVTATVEDGSFEAMTTSAGVNITASKSLTMLEVNAASDNASSLTATAGTTITMNENVGASGTEIGSVSLTAGTAYSSVGGAADMDVNGTVTLDAGTTMAIGDQDDVAATGAISVTGGTTVSVDGDITSGAGGVTVTGGTSVTQLDNGIITATTGNIDITAGTTYTAGSAVTASAGDVVVTAVSSDINADITGTNITLNGSSLTVASNVQSLTGAVSLVGDGHTFTFDASDSITGNLTIVGDAILDMDQGTNLMTGSVTHSGAGAVGLTDLAGNYIGGSATGAVTIADTAAGAASIVTGSGADSVTLGNVETAVSTGAGNDTINAAGVTTTTNMVNINGGAGNDTITGGSATDDIYTGGSGTDTLNIAGNDILFGFTERFTDFEVGSAGDILSLDVSELDTLGGDVTSTTVTQIDTTDVGTTTFADTQLIILTGTTYADVAAVVAALNGTSGTTGSVAANTDGVVTVFADTDGHSYMTILEGDGSNAFSATDQELLRFDGLGIADLANMTQDNFVIV